jgi:hypothetical protein
MSNLMEDNQLYNSSKTSTKRIFTLENFNFKEQKHKINRYITHNSSPRSLEAMFSLGYTPEDLYYLDFKTFKANHPEIITLPEEMQRFKYQYTEQKRQKRIEACKIERNRLIAEIEEGKGFVQSSNSNQAFSMSNGFSSSQEKKVKCG